MVQTGLPQNFPKLLILSAVAQPDAVELIFANPRSAAHPGGTTVTILLTVGGGPLAGGPQPPP